MVFLDMDVHVLRMAVKVQMLGDLFSEHLLYGF